METVADSISRKVTHLSKEKTQETLPWNVVFNTFVLFYDFRFGEKKFVFFFLTEKGVCCLFVVYLHPAALHQRLHIVNIVTTSSYVSLAQLSCHTFLLMFFLFLFFKFVVCEMPLIWISKETTGRYSSRRWHSSNTPTISLKNELIFVVFFLFSFSFECFL
jgi:hypothetical protein